MQMRFNAMTMLVVVASFAMFWFAGRDVCANWTVTWLGNTPVLLAFTCMTCIMLFITQCRIPSDGHVAPSFVGQEFAWTYQSMQVCPPVLCLAATSPADRQTA